jgi:predicted 3-demethylubiquinone-9 3-methyltransferase (glyoxalase superfamily)
MPHHKIAPHLWYVKEAEEAARYYASIFPDSRVVRVDPLPAASPSGPAGSVQIVQFLLFGQPFTAISAGPLDAFNHAISFQVFCEDQKEIDRYYDTLVRDGGTEENCGWVKDKYGLSWQIVPRALQDLITDQHRDKAARAAEAMLKMKKLDLAALKRAYDGG